MGDILALEQYLPAVGRFEVAEQPGKGRLAAAGLARRCRGFPLCRHRSETPRTACTVRRPNRRLRSRTS